MDQTRHISQVSELVRNRLARFVNDPNARIGQLFLIAKNELKGVRFTFGPFVANWNLSEPTVRIMRDGQEIMLIDLASNSSASKAA